MSFGKQGGTAERPFVPETTKGFLFVKGMVDLSLIQRGAAPQEDRHE